MNKSVNTIKLLFILFLGCCFCDVNLVGQSLEPEFFGFSIVDTVLKMDADSLVKNLISGQYELLRCIELIEQDYYYRQCFSSRFLYYFVIHKIFGGYEDYKLSVSKFLRPGGGYLSTVATDCSISLWRLVTDFNQILLILILKYLKKENRMHKFYKVVNLPHLNRKDTGIQLALAWSAFNPTEQRYLKQEFGIDEQVASLSNF